MIPNDVNDRLDSNTCLPCSSRQGKEAAVSTNVALERLLDPLPSAVFLKSVQRGESRWAIYSQQSFTPSLREPGVFGWKSEVSHESSCCRATRPLRWRYEPFGGELCPKLF